jgi:hypothetical protein
LNEIEIRFRKEDPQEIIDKREKNLKEHFKIKKLVTLMGKGELLIGVISHIISDDNTGEFDPYYIERIKNAL